uniref:Uncharacterized protein n=1 Tax=Sciurus vulgaris TaxID=55149 RepID=A0A8D2CN95_SCIVU
MANRGATRQNGPNTENKICQFQLVLLGESAVGKSSLVLQSAIGAALLTQIMCLDDTTVKFEIWGTTGQEQYHRDGDIAHLAPMYYRGAQAAIVVYDITKGIFSQSYADDNSLLFMETSAKTSVNVNEIFMAVAKKLPKNEPQNPGANSARGRGVDLTKTTQPTRSQCCSN